MKKMLTVILVVVFLLFCIGSIGLAQVGPNGPAPESHDGVSEGSGLESPFGLQDGVGPAPSAGDSVPDGPGW
ncbi:MAG: hypothetical protein JXC36_03405 [Candidatus Atribacteria bacterium]|nr:hypothetical protein [Candidatus Atribacteria bacterium]